MGFECLLLKRQGNADTLFFLKIPIDVDSLMSSGRSLFDILLPFYDFRSRFGEVFELTCQDFIEAVDDVDVHVTVIIHIYEVKRFIYISNIRGKKV